MSLNLENILFIDTESHPLTKKPECITWFFRTEKGIIDTFNHETYNFFKEKWNTADAVIMFNAPYDMGALSIFFSQNSYKWITKQIKNEKSSSWEISLFDNIYDVRKISFFRNMIRNKNRKNEKITRSHHKGKKSTPVIDLLKLWSIIVSDTDISLKSLIKKELKKTAIPYSEQNAKTEAYRYQDVICLKELSDLFFTEKIKNITEVKEFGISEWTYIKTPATFTKILYKNEYPKLNTWKKENDETLKNMELEKATEMAFHGGITLSLYRGEIKNAGWFDIKGAYSKGIEVLNTDSYLRFDIQQTKIENINFEKPFLCKIKTNFVMQSINKSLKLFYVEEKTEVWIWNFDIIACKNIAQDYYYELLEVYEIIPGNNIENSLPEQWNEKKNEENKLNGKTTLYNFYKFLSNTSYGIKAQRKPFQTPHTNMIIAGMITSKVHQILSEIIKTLSENGFRNVYNDTDSSLALASKSMTFESVTQKINENIFPFQVEFEGEYKKSIILSLKRYISIKNETLSHQDKIKLHGKGRYRISADDITDYVLNQKCTLDEYLSVSQMSASTEISMKQILNLFPFLEQYKHPFMFVKDIKTSVLKSEFFQGWYYHIDTKTTFDVAGASFFRYFHEFATLREAHEFFTNYKIEDINDES